MRLFGLGIDITDLTRPEFAEHNFSVRYMTHEELNSPLCTPDNYQYRAGIWALKEAIIKATNHKFNIQDINIRFTSEAPLCELNGYKLYLSISYEKQMAVAIAICFIDD